MEIHASNEPVALMITPTGQIRPFKIKAKDRYFVVNEKKVKGIFTINNKYRFSWGKTPCYFYAIPETNPIDPVIINELNLFKKRNKLTEIKHKDIKHGSRLRILKKQNEAEPIKRLREETEIEGAEINEEITHVSEKIDERIENLKTMHQKEIDVADSQKGYILLEHLDKIEKITKQQKTDMLNKIETGTISFDEMVDDLRSANIVDVSEPLDENIEDFVQDLGAQNARDMAGFVEDLRNNKRGLKDMTAAPIKAYMPAGYLLAIIIGIVIAIPVLVSNGPAISKALESGGLPGVNMDFFGGNFIFEILRHIPGLF